MAVRGDQSPSCSVVRFFEETWGSGSSEVLEDAPGQGSSFPAVGVCVGALHGCVFVPGGAALWFLPVAFQHQLFKLLWSVPTVPWARRQAAVDDTGLIGCNLYRHLQ